MVFGPLHLFAYGIMTGSILLGTLYKDEVIEKTANWTIPKLTIPPPQDYFERKVQQQIFVEVKQDGSIVQMREWKPIIETNCTKELEIEKQKTQKLADYIKELRRPKQRTYLENTIENHQILQAKLDQMFGGYLTPLFYLFESLLFFSWVYSAIHKRLFPPKVDKTDYEKLYKEVRRKYLVIKDELQLERMKTAGKDENETVQEIETNDQPVDTNTE
eukprot:TRINITY_DN14176_c0_g1_i1.p1 TRINITY_DN14176_c0_g1~~TRINITY_DN14176_c0_g1_i1.p1  ORF type:complete len:217 (+),score=46.68 TRINITY_DN14176_c0_g1_i1:32-682(+)